MCFIKFLSHYLTFSVHHLVLRFPRLVFPSTRRLQAWRASVASHRPASSQRSITGEEQILAPTFRPRVVMFVVALRWKGLSGMTSLASQQTHLVQVFDKRVLSGNLQIFIIWPQQCHSMACFLLIKSGIAL